MHISIEIPESVMTEDLRDTDIRICQIQRYRIGYDVFHKMRHTSNYNLVYDDSCVAILVRTITNYDGDVILRNIWFNYDYLGMFYEKNFENMIDWYKSGMSNTEIQSLLKL